jgi:hypothetical protein
VQQGYAMQYYLQASLTSLGFKAKANNILLNFKYLYNPQQMSNPQLTRYLDMMVGIDTLMHNSNYM